VNTHVDGAVIPGHTYLVKFAISVPDDLFEAVDAQAGKLGISRSQFFADAAREHLKLVSLPERVAYINSVIAETGYDGPDDDTLRAMSTAFAQSMHAGGWEWDDADS
jgi:hypothetical protein